MERRRFLQLIVGGAAALVGGVLGIPGLLTALSPALRRGRGPVWVPVGNLDAFPEGQVRPALVSIPRSDWNQALRSRAVYVSRVDGEAVVFSRSCTDLGCPVQWDEGSGWFLCPCHGGIFSQDGRPQAGPPSRPLYRYATRVEGGVLEIDLRSVPPMV